LSRIVNNREQRSKFGIWYDRVVNGANLLLRLRELARDRGWDLSWLDGLSPA
jgi:hypothetical protein